MLGEDTGTVYLKCDTLGSHLAKWSCQLEDRQSINRNLHFSSNGRIYV
jgi:hypothetical protein